MQLRNTMQIKLVPKEPYPLTGSILNKVSRVIDHLLLNHANAFLGKNQGSWSPRGVIEQLGACVAIHPGGKPFCENKL